jgi:hypothetical protein
VRRIATEWLLAALLLSACKDHAPSPADIADRGWHAHEIVIAAGEHAKTCAEAGPAMQQLFVVNRQAFVDAVALDNDKSRLQEATDFIAEHGDRYDGLELRMEALASRCADDAAVQAVFRQMEAP